MYARLTIAAIAAMIGVGATAQAQPMTAQKVFYGAGPSYAGAPFLLNGANVNCRVFNFGTTNVTISQRQIFTSSGVAVKIAGNSCGVLKPGKSCAFYSNNSADNVAYSCRLTGSGTSVNISGVVEIQDESSNILAVLPLTK